MRRFDQLLKELGFNKDASPGAQAAFFKHLIQASPPVSLHPPMEKKTVTESDKQLSFDPEILKARAK